MSPAPLLVYASSSAGEDVDGIGIDSETRAGRLARRSSDFRASWKVATSGDFAARSLAIRRSVAPALVSARPEGFSSVSAR